MNLTLPEGRAANLWLLTVIERWHENEPVLLTESYPDLDSLIADAWSCTGDGQAIVGVLGPAQAGGWRTFYRPHTVEEWCMDAVREAQAQAEDERRHRPSWSEG